MSIQSVREFIGRHSVSAAGLVALGAALEARASGVPLEPAFEARVRDMLAALGAGDALDGVGAEEALPTLGLLRFTLLLDNKMLFADKRSSIWNHVEPEILGAGGDGSVGHAQMLSRAVAPALDGLSDRLAAPGAALLDVGTGVAGLAIAMARMWPELRVVGLDPWQPSLALARKNVHAAELEQRIELREQAGEDLTDEAAFDLAWVAVPFMQERALPKSFARTLRALRPGGWVVCAVPNAGDDPAVAAMWRLRTTLWGGHSLGASDIEAMLRGEGYVEVHVLPSPPGAPVATVVGRRQPD